MRRSTTAACSRCPAAGPNTAPTGPGRARTAPRPGSNCSTVRGPTAARPRGTTPARPPASPPHQPPRPGLRRGVVTFSEAQAAGIEPALGEARKQPPDLDRFFGSDRLRGFFVKNVAAAQGDERDVLILSVGYGPDEEGQDTTD